MCKNTKNDAQFTITTPFKKKSGLYLPYHITQPWLLHEIFQYLYMYLFGSIVGDSLPFDPMVNRRAFTIIVRV